MLKTDSNALVLAPIRTVYRFDLFLAEKFASETICLNHAEDAHLRSQVAIGKNWATVHFILEDWRSHLITKAFEWDEAGRQTSIQHLGPDWAYERRGGEQTLYADIWDSEGSADLWRRYLSPAREEYLTLEIVDFWSVRLASEGGRFGQSWVPDALEPKEENIYLLTSFAQKDLLNYRTDDGSWPNTAWRQSYKGDESNGISWRLQITDLQEYLGQGA